jgi:hypothetical protein
MVGNRRAFAIGLEADIGSARGCAKKSTKMADGKNEAMTCGYYFIVTHADASFPF